MRRAAFVAVLVMALAVTASGQTSQTPKKFLGGPLTIEDQGSFFVGGVQKVTEYAVVPGRPLQAPPRRRRPTSHCPNRSPSVRCTCSSRFRPRSTAAAGR